MNVTIEHVEEAWGNFKKYTETAEQHEFSTLAAIQCIGEPLYEDLHENWDEGHAEVFLKWMQKVGKSCGFEVPDISGGGNNVETEETPS